MTASTTLSEFITAKNNQLHNEVEQSVKRSINSTLDEK